MKKKFLFSILLPTYNSSNFLDQLLESISNQSMRNFIIITYDDLSDDNTLEKFSDICSFYKLDYKRINSFKKRIGPKLAYEKLICETETPYLVFCDHDDYWLPNKLFLHYEHFNKSINKPTLSILNASVVRNDLKETNYSVFDHFKISDKYFKSKFSMALENKIPGICMSFNKELKKYIIPFDKNVVMHDWWVLLKSKSMNVNIVFSKEKCLLYRQHEKNTIGLKNRSKDISPKRIKSFFIGYKKQAKMVYSAKIFNFLEYVCFLFLRLFLGIKNSIL